MDRSCGLLCCSSGLLAGAAGRAVALPHPVAWLPMTGGDGYNLRMSIAKRPDVESIPADLDRFLGTFFNRRGWRSEIKFDPAEDRLYLEVRLESHKLSADDRFLSLVEYFARAQDAVLRQQAGLPLQARLYASDGSELTTALHARGSSYLDDDARGSGMRRRLAWNDFFLREATEKRVVMYESAFSKRSFRTAHVLAV